MKLIITNHIQVENGGLEGTLTLTEHQQTDQQIGAVIDGSVDGSGLDHLAMTAALEQQNMMSTTTASGVCRCGDMTLEEYSIIGMKRKHNLWEEIFHWNLNFANGKFAKLKFRLSSDFYKSYNDGLYIGNSKINNC